jgi:two-component system LytT family response regulator
LLFGILDQLIISFFIKPLTMEPYLKFDIGTGLKKFKNTKTISLVNPKTEVPTKPIKYKVLDNIHPGRIAIPTLEGFEILHVAKILRCEANGNYTKIIYDGNNFPIMVSRQLKCLENALLKSGFLRIHHSHLINPLYIKKILKSEGGQVEMEDGTKIRISKNKDEIIETLFNSFEKI